MGISNEDIEDEDFLELGLQSNNLDLESLPKRLKTQAEILVGERASPRIAKQKTDQCNEKRQYMVHS